jgi:hypothetical protein
LSNSRTWHNVFLHVHVGLLSRMETEKYQQLETTKIQNTNIYESHVLYVAV